MMLMKAKIAYDGSNYAGWQKQINALGIQEVFEKALEKIHHQPTEVVASGRTDAKVHAMGQVVHFEARSGITCQQYQKALNGILPRDIRVLVCEEAKEGFHARFSATGKRYRYICTTNQNDPFCFPYKSIVYETLDIKPMREASQYLIGSHDFTSFSSHKIDPRKPRVKTIASIEINAHGDDIEFEFIGSGFLRYQVRMMVGALMAVGRHKQEPEALKRMLEAKDKHACPYNAPPQGLYLMEVYYGR